MDYDPEFESMAQQAKVRKWDGDPTALDDDFTGVHEAMAKDAKVARNLMPKKTKHTWFDKQAAFVVGYCVAADWLLTSLGTLLSA